MTVLLKIIIIASLASLSSSLINCKVNGLLLRKRSSILLGRLGYSKPSIPGEAFLFQIRSSAIDEKETTTTFSNNILPYLEKFTFLFPIWVLLFSLIGFRSPQLLLWFTPYITPALALTMTSMGMTLSFKDFTRIFKSWRYVLLGFLAQYSIMPFTAALISKLAGLSTEMATGLILVGCAPGGTASNIVIETDRMHPSLCHVALKFFMY